jgi:hypothetical protein
MKNYPESEKCKNENPALVEVENGHFVSCHFWKEAHANAANVIHDSN